MNGTSTKGAALAGALAMLVALIAAGVLYSLSKADANPARPAVAQRAVAREVPAPTTSTTVAPAGTGQTAAPAQTVVVQQAPARREVVRETRVVEKPVPVPVPVPVKGEDRVIVVEQQPAPQPAPRSNAVATSPASGPAGSTITFSASDSCGTGSAAGTVDIAAVDPNGRTAASRRLASYGSWSASLTLPSNAVAGDYRLNASCIQGDVARVLEQNRFVVTATANPRFSMDRTTVAPGSDITVSSVDGCPSAQSVRVTLVDSQGIERGSAIATVDQWGGWGATLPVHATTPNGQFSVQATCTTPSQIVRYVPQAMQVSGPSAVY